MDEILNLVRNNKPDGNWELTKAMACRVEAPTAVKVTYTNVDQPKETIDITIRKVYNEYRVTSRTHVLNGKLKWCMEEII